MRSSFYMYHVYLHMSVGIYVHMYTCLRANTHTQLSLCMRACVCVCLRSYTIPMYFLFRHKYMGVCPVADLHQTSGMEANRAHTPRTTVQRGAWLRTQFLGSGCCCKVRVLFVGRALLFVVYIAACDVWKLPYWACGLVDPLSSSQPATRIQAHGRPWKLTTPTTKAHTWLQYPTPPKCSPNGPSPVKYPHTYEQVHIRRRRVHHCSRWNCLRFLMMTCNTGRAVRSG